jgi:hypothetical protein
MNSRCVDHTGHEARIVNLEKNKDEQWKAIDCTRESLNKLSIKISGQVGAVVGGLIVIQMIVERVWP